MHNALSGRASRTFFPPMKFHLNSITGNVFTGYGPGYVEVNRQRIESNLLVTADAIHTGWAPDGFAGLSRDDFAALLRFDPEIVLLGTGDALRFPHPRLTTDLTAKRIGVDVMDVKAACRTFNVLSAEGRKVLAALIVEIVPA
jgi:uncharacterized protein